MIVSLFAVLAASEFKISHLNALLQFKDPQSAKTPHFTISAEGSCVNWTSLNLDVIKIIPNYESRFCSRSALVEVVATGPKRKSTSIIAETLNSAQILKCDVFVDSIATISILTTTRSIYVESSLETLYLQALDADKNVFTSLDGTDIKWDIDTAHLRKIDPRDAKVSMTSNSPKPSSASLIIQGTQVGKTWATATLDNELKADVNLVVVEPIALFPSPVVRVMPFTNIPFQLCSIRGTQENEPKGKCVSKVSLPSDMFSVDTSNNEIITTDQTAYVTTHKIGTASVIAIDKNINDNQASSLVVVNYPNKAVQEEQYIALGDNPKFEPKLYDANGYLFSVFGKIDWEIIGDWSTIGRKEITLKYHDYSFIAIVHVVGPIVITPEKAILPVGYTGFPIKISGGSGDYDLRVENPSICEVKSSKVNTLKEGESFIQVSDKRVSKYTASTRIIVSRVGSIDITVVNREQINKNFEPICSVHARDQQRFSVDVTYNTMSSDLDIVSNSMKPIRPGFSYIYCESDGTKSKSIYVSVASNPVAKIDGIATPNSKIPLIINGGVMHWPNSNPPSVSISCLGRNVNMINNNMFSVDQEYSGACSLTMKNEKTKENPYPVTVNTTFDLEVSNVSKFSIHIIDEKSTADSRCSSPPNRLSGTVSSQEMFRVVAGHLLHVYIFLHNYENKVIKYHSSVSFDLKTASGDYISPLVETSFDGSTKYYYTPSQSTSLKLFSQNELKKSVQLKVLTKFSVESSKYIYYKRGIEQAFKIKGGSGLFKTTAVADVSLDQAIINIRPSKPGILRIPIQDVCSDDPVQYAELNSVSVVSLQIIAPSIIAINTEFDVVVKAYGQNSQLIPSDVLKEAEITLSLTSANKVKEDTWRVNPTTLGKLRIIARAENGAVATHVVDVIQSIIISPQYIELLPGETQPITIISGPLSMRFEGDDEKIAKFDINKHEIFASSPGQTIIKATVADVAGLVPFQIYVTVLNPIELRLIPSSSSSAVIQFGQLALKLVVHTEKGDRNVGSARWTLPNDMPYEMPNSSFAIINCTKAKDIRISASAYGLTASHSASIEPKLKLISPPEVVLTTFSDFPIVVENNLVCQFKSFDESIAVVENGLIKSGQNEGETVILVKHGHQTLAITVRVTKPNYIYVYQSSQNDFQINILDPYGLQFSSKTGINYELTSDGYDAKIRSAGNDGRFIASNINPKSVKEICLKVTVKNSGFSLHSTMNISSSVGISPERPTLLKGTSKQFHCSLANQYWSSEDRSIATVGSDGTVSAKKSGITQISCGNGLSTTVKVVDIAGVTLTAMSNDNDEYEIHPIFIPNSNMKELQKPSDFTTSCELDPPQCGTATYIERNGQNICKIDRNRNSICPSKAKVRVSIKSVSTRIFVAGEAQYNIGQHTSQSSPTTLPSTSDSSSRSKTNIRVTISSKTNSIEVPVGNLKKDETRIESTNGLTAYFSQYGGTVTVAADKSFSSIGFVKLHNKINGEIVTIEVHNEQPNRFGSAQTNVREFNPNQDIKFYTSLVLVFAGIFYIIVKLTSSGYEI